MAKHGIGLEIKCETEECKNTFIKNTPSHRFCKDCKIIRGRIHSAKGNARLRAIRLAKREREKMKSVNEPVNVVLCKCPSCEIMHYLPGYENSKTTPRVYCAGCTHNRNRSFNDGEIYHCV